MNQAVRKQGSMRILFVGHSADRSGAPLFLLHFLKWLRANKNEMEFDLLLKKGGELVEEYSVVAKPMFWSLECAAIRFLDRNRIWGKRRESFTSRNMVARMHQRRLLSRLSCENYDLIFINSFANADFLPEIAAAINAPVICRAPELQSVIIHDCGESEVRKALPFITSFIAVSDTVARFMNEGLGIPPECIVEIPGFIRPRLPTPSTRTTYRGSLGIPSDALVVVGSGSVSMRKGADLFVQIAINTIQNNPDIPVHFLWIGDIDGSVFSRQVQDEVAASQMGTRIILAGKTTNPERAFAASDIFALTSREDPFPLVALEAAQAGLPIVCFDGPIGTAALARRGAGLTVPHLSTPKFSEALEQLLREPSVRTARGKTALLLSHEYEYHTICSRLYEHIESVMNTCQDVPSGIRKERYTS